MKYLIILAAAIVAVAGQAPKNRATSSTTTTGKPVAPKLASPTPKPGDFALNLTFVLTGKSIPTKDSNSKVDGYVQVFSKTGAAEEVLVGTTDTLKDNDNPEWLNVFWINWKRGTQQKLHFIIKDHDTLGKDDDVGEVTIDVDQYVDKNQDLKVPLVPEGGELLIKRTQPTRFQLYARNVPHKDQFNGKSDPYVEVYWRVGKEGADHLIGSTAIINDEENPDWKETFEFSNYQKGTNQYLFFKVLDSDALTGSDFLGELLVEADPYVTKRATKITKLTKGDGITTLGITPV